MGCWLYTICQGWGNTPEQFEKDTKGEALLKAAVAWSVGGGTNKIFEEQITQRIGYLALQIFNKTRKNYLIPMLY